MQVTFNHEPRPWGIIIREGVVVVGLLYSTELYVQSSTYNLSKLLPVWGESSGLWYAETWILSIRILNFIFKIRGDLLDWCLLPCVDVKESIYLRLLNFSLSLSQPLINLPAEEALFRWKIAFLPKEVYDMMMMTMARTRTVKRRSHKAIFYALFSEPGQDWGVKNSPKSQAN